MEMSVSMELEPRITRREETALKESYAMEVPLARHEAAMMRLGYLESELAGVRLRAKEKEYQEHELQERTKQAEAGLIQAQLRAGECEARLEEMRSQVIDCTFKAVELQDEVKRLQDRLMASWWSRLLDAIATRKGGAAPSNNR